MSLQGFLTRLIWLCVLPLLLLAAYLAVHQVKSLEAARDLEAANLAKNIAATIDQELNARIAALRLLAASPNADDASRMKAFYQEAQAFVQNYGGHVLLGNTQKRMLFNTRTPFGTALPPLQEIKRRNAALIALETGKPAMGDTFMGPVDQERQVGAAVPIVRDGKQRAVVVTTVETREFQNRLEQVALPSGWSLALLDSRGEVIARTPPPALNAPPGVDTAGRFVAGLASAPWSVVLEIPRDIHQAPLVSAALWLAIVIAGAALISSVGGMLASRRLARGVKSLAYPGSPGAPAPYIREIADARDFIDQSLARREVAEKARHLSEQLFRAIFDQAAVGIAQVAPDGRWLRANEKLCDITGYRHDELLSLTFQDITHPDDLDADLGYVRQMLSGEIDSYAIEKRYIHKKGSVVWINLTVALTRHADGSPDYFISVIEDIRRRKETEQELRARESALNEAQQLAGVGSWKWDLRTNQHVWSEETYRIHGRDAASPPANYAEVQSCFTPGSWIHLSAAVEACIAWGTPYECDAEIVRADGTRCWITARGDARRDADGKVLELHGTLQDITERKLVVDAMKESEAFKRAILDSMSAQIAVLDRDGIIVAVNESWRRFALENSAEPGVSANNTLIGINYLAICEASSAEEARDAYEGIRRVLDGRLPSFRLEYPCHSPHQQRWFIMFATPLGAKVQGAVITHTDITAHKRDEVELEQHHHHLEQLVSSRTAELAEARNAAEAANKAKSRFLAAASHDLRQPLLALSLYVGVLKKRVSPDNAELVNSIQDCLDSLSELLTDLLDVSKLDAGVVTPRCSDFAIDDLLATLVSVHSIEARLKGLHLRWRNSDTIAHTDQTLFGRILGNLVANAIRFTEKGGVLIASRRHQGKRWIEIWDTGIGIAENKTAIIFEEFSQIGDNSRNRGSGLGLAIVVKTARLLGLGIRLRSRPGRGSMFAIELPQGRTPAPLGSPLVNAAPRALRIGLVEDNAEVLRALVLALENEGYEVLAATSAQGLIERLNNQKPDIVISDYRLSSEETGFDVIALAKEAFGADLPALLITGDTDPALVRSMADRGIAVHYKPLQLSALKAIIIQATERRSS